MTRTHFIIAAVACSIVTSAGGFSAPAQASEQAAPAYAPTVGDWASVNAAVNNYTLGLERQDTARFDRAFWPEAMVIAQPEPGVSFSMPYRQVAAPPPPPPAGSPPMTNAAGGTTPPWHLSLSHHFEFQSATRATHLGYFVSVYPNLETKVSTVGLPGHYEDILEKRGDEWRIIERKTVIGTK